MTANIKNLEAVINEIAQNLECGLNSFYNPKTGELVALPAEIDEYSDEFETFQDDFEKIDQNGQNYISFEVLESWESFVIMEDFVSEMPESKIKTKLHNAISNSKPFKNFNAIIHQSLNRDDWFQFKTIALENRVRNIMLEEIPNFQ